MLNAAALVGTHDVLLLTLDSLRYDVAQGCWERGETPFLASLLPPGGWERRHSPGNFTFAAHSAFFAGFLPTPVAPGRHARLFGVRFAGSETITDHTAVFDAPDIVHGFQACGYTTVCIGGVGFFNPQHPLGRVLPGYFQRAHWTEPMGVTSPHSTRIQVETALQEIDSLAPSQRLFLFVNVSAMHQPNCIFTPGATVDTPATMADALAYVEGQLKPLFTALRRRAPLLAVLCSDHGVAYGEDGYHGLRFNHPTVGDVPYAEMLLPQISPADGEARP